MVIQKLTNTLYNPSVRYNKSDLSNRDQKSVLESNFGEFISIYRIPSSIIPQLQVRVILTTKGLLIKENQYSRPIQIYFNNTTKVSIEESYLRVFASSYTYEFKMPSNSYIFGGLVTEQYAEYQDVDTSNLHEKSIDSLEEKFGSNQ